MGLDMYLVKNKNWNYENDQLGYWRKSNQIHGWFVDNVQNGIDDCGIYKVTKKQLKELKELCETVRDNRERAEELLPVRQGFFFGSYDYDEWYFKNIEDTINIINRILQEYKGTIYYNSSW